MKLHLYRTKKTLATVTVTASSEELSLIKNKVLHKLSNKVKVTGFREGKAPIEMVEKNINQQQLQTEFLDEAINTLYIAAIKEERLRPIGQPKVEIKKFVPFTALEVDMQIPVIGEIKLANYKKLSAKRAVVKVTSTDVDNVLQNLRARASDKKEVSRTARKGDEVIIDFEGVDEMGEKIAGATGKKYPLVLGSGSFIPGFEDQLVGLKKGQEKKFKTTFPKDYGVALLKNAKVTFKVTVLTVNEITEPEINQEFLKKFGPFKNVEELKTDIKKQLELEKKQKNERDYESAIVQEISAKSKVEIPESLIKEQQDMVLQEVRQNAIQRGITYQEYLKNTGLEEEDFVKKEVIPESKRRVKAGLILSEIADLEGIKVRDEELEVKIKQLKAQYKDKKMQEQLDQPANQREIAGRLRTEKVIEFLKSK